MNKEHQKTALVIGGSRGIGRATAVKLANSGFDIWLTYYKSSEAAKEAQAEIKKKGRDCKLFSFDVSISEQVKEALSEDCDKRAPDALVFNSGISKDNLMVWMTKQEWDKVISTNLTGFYNVMNVVLFPLLKEKRGRIIVVSSASGEIGQAGQVNYAASKAGLIGAMKSLAREVGQKNIFVNAVSPGLIETEMIKDLPKKTLLNLIPMKKIGKPEDVASVINFLCTEQDMYIHGQVIGVNGGLAI